MHAGVRITKQGKEMNGRRSLNLSLQRFRITQVNRVGNIPWGYKGYVSWRMIRLFKCTIYINTSWFFFFAWGNFKPVTPFFCYQEVLIHLCCTDHIASCVSETYFALNSSTLQYYGFLFSMWYTLCPHHWQELLLRPLCLWPWQKT